MLKKSMLTTAATLGIAALGMAAGTKVASADTTYTVQSGDTLSGIVNRLGKDYSLVNKLAQDNNIQNKDLIYVGQKITIKDDGDVVLPVSQGSAATVITTADSASASQAPVSAATSATSATSAVSASATVSAAPVASASAQSAASASQAPAQSAAPQASQAPQSAAPVATPAQSSATSAVTTKVAVQNTTSSNSAEEAARLWIMGKESSGNYSASNGSYYGAYQLDRAYLNGDYSAANQDKVANNYVTSRYGSWTAAKAYWQQHGWY